MAAKEPAIVSLIFSPAAAALERAAAVLPPNLCGNQTTLRPKVQYLQTMKTSLKSTALQPCWATFSFMVRHVMSHVIRRPHESS